MYSALGTYRPHLPAMRYCCNVPSAACCRRKVSAISIGNPRGNFRYVFSYVHTAAALKISDKIFRGISQSVLFWLYVTRNKLCPLQKRLPQLGTRSATWGLWHQLKPTGCLGVMMPLVTAQCNLPEHSQLYGLVGRYFRKSSESLIGDLGGGIYS